MNSRVTSSKDFVIHLILYSYVAEVKNAFIYFLAGLYSHLHSLATLSYPLRMVIHIP